MPSRFSRLSKVPVWGYVLFVTLATIGVIGTGTVWWSMNTKQSYRDANNGVITPEQNASVDKDALDAGIKILQTLGALGFFYTAYLSYRNLQVSAKNLEISEDKQVTERFSKAVELLSESDKLEARIGGIYLLERIARDSPEDHWTVMEVLITYVCSKSPVSKLENNEAERISVDVQAALTVIGRRNAKNDGESRKVDLGNANLFGADLGGADLRGALFCGADLRGALFCGADLSEADLSRAILYEAGLSEADLTGANLQGADLTGTHLEEAELTEANLTGANLTGTHLEEADLTGANLTGANLEGADLTRAVLTRAELTEAELTEANLTEANLEGADLEGADLRAVVSDAMVSKVQSAENWQSASYNDEFRRKLGLDTDPLNSEQSDLKNRT